MRVETIQKLFVWVRSRRFAASTLHDWEGLGHHCLAVCLDIPSSLDSINDIQSDFDSSGWLKDKARVSIEECLIQME